MLIVVDVKQDDTLADASELIAEVNCGGALGTAAFVIGERDDQNGPATEFMTS